jgi:hypothetical protein
MPTPPDFTLSLSLSLSSSFVPIRKEKEREKEIEERIVGSLGRKRKRDAERKQGVPDDDGFILVSRKS